MNINEIIIKGARDDTAEYDFEKDVELHCYNVADEAHARVPGKNGETKLDVTVKRVSGKLICEEYKNIIDICEE